MLMIKIRGKFTKEKQLKYIGHLDTMRLFDRAFRRGNIPIVYTQGFNPQPKLSFATALPLGVESHGEYFDVELKEEMDIIRFIEDLNKALPNDIRILKAVYIDDKKSVMSLIRWSDYIVEAKFEEEMTREELDTQIKSFMDLEEIIVVKEKEKKGKVKKREVNIRELIKSLDVLQYEDFSAIFKTTLKTGSEGNLKPVDMFDAIGEYTDIKIKKDSIKTQRLELFVENDGEMATPI